MRIRLTLLGLVCASWLFAQEAPFFPTPSYFRKAFSTPTGRVELQPPVRLADFVLDGKLELSLRAYLDLVMANNTDIAVQKLSVETARNNIMTAFRGFDPTLTASFTNQRSATLATDQLTGAVTSKSLSQPARFQYSQTLLTGTQFSVGFNGSKSTNNSSFSNYNPNLQSSLSFNVSQPLLRGRGAYITKLPITIARINLRSTQFNTQNSIEQLIVNAETAYWDVVGNRENLKVQEAALANSAESLKRSERELELGALAPLDIFQPRADYASAQIQVSQARFRLAQSEDALRKQIGADLDPKMRNIPILLTETVAPPEDSAPLDRDALVEKGLASRADAQVSRIALELDDLSIRQYSDALRPQLSLTGSHTANGQGGTQFVRSGGAIGGSVTTVIPGTFYDALGQMFGYNYTVWSFGLNLTLPIRDRAGNANLANALVRKKSDSLNLRSREQSIRLDVLNAISQVESSRESVKLAIVARDLAQKQLDAEWQKYNLGSELMYYVLDAQTRLTTAASRVVTESVNYQQNQLNLLRVTGQLLAERRITIQ